ncbi:methyltransferase-like protein 25 isoform X2 [Belonocnema kinseyi]|uniref:methyltransferase-like protein 25 isoform X2 n=1 Tax=Belonocnema kinseyi TaxID=2817044 RepID=UPI00143CD147|nr:methyltransferase-like protein 25 isoform X2 [Belonocnema kinseyi]
MTHYEDHFKAILELLDKYENLTNCHLVDFLKHDLWNKFVPLSMKLDLEEIASKNFGIDWWKTELSCELNAFKNITKSLKLDSCPGVMNFKDWSECLEKNKLDQRKEEFSVRNKCHFMNRKKWHEVEIFSQAISNLTNSTSSLVIDAGAGKAYLSEYMSKTYDVPVLAIESSQSHYNSALIRRELMRRKQCSSSKRNLSNTVGKDDFQTCMIHWLLTMEALDGRRAHKPKQRFEQMKEEVFVLSMEEGGSSCCTCSRWRRAHLVQYIMKSIDKTTDYSDLAATHLPNYNVNKNVILVGLHTCGTLTHSMAESFVNTKDIKGLCVVPCCYHLMTDSLTGKQIFSKNSKMLAQQSIDRTSRKTEPMKPTLFYRAILEILLSSMGLNDAKVGRGAPLTDFPNYAQWALMKIGIPSEQIPSIEFLKYFYKSHVSSKWKFEVFQLLRIHLSSVIEAAIILDIVMYIQRRGHSCKTSVVKFFDCAISPRNYAIIATK